jgi:signal transduction histidine kinase
MPFRMETSLINIFRLFVVIRIFFIVLGFLRMYDELGTDLIFISAVDFSLNVLLLLYLFSQPLAQRLAHRYLVVALVALTAFIIVEAHISQWVITQKEFSAPLLPDLQNRIQLGDPAITLLFTMGSTTSLLVPLVFISWQYTFRSVLLFILLTTFFDILFIITWQSYESLQFFIAIFGIFTRNISFMIVGYIVSQLVAEQRRQHLALQESNHALALYATTREKLVVSQERNRLARELHDTIAHTMSAVTVKLNATHIMMERDPERAKTMVTEIIQSMNEGMLETRRALRDLRATPLDDMGLVLAVRHLAESAAQRGKFALDLDTPLKEVTLSPDVELGIYRIAQEALTNVVEHANAKCVRLVMNENDRGFTLQVEDDGVGFDPQATETNGHFGLKGIKERAAMLGAELKIKAAQQQGTQIEVRLGKAL